MPELPEDFDKYAVTVLQSETLRNAPTSRRLLKYFLDRAHNPHAEPLKEYTVGVEAFAKPAEYDPRLDSTVRIQMSRLRQKLADYYAAEGKADPLVFNLPKGRLQLVCLRREDPPLPPETEAATEPEPEPDPDPVPHSEPAAPLDATPPRSAPPWRVVALTAAGSLLVALLLLLPLTRRDAASTAGTGAWSDPLDELWRPLTQGTKPLLITYGDPLFAQFKNKVLFRDPSIEDWDALRQSALVAADPDARPVHYYAAAGDVHSAFLLGQRLAPRAAAPPSLVRNSQLLWRQMADANVLFLGPPRFFGERLSSLPVTLAIAETPEGFRVLEPRPGEEAVYAYREPAGYFSEDGEACVLVTRAAGPGGASDVLIFASNSTFGRLGAVDAFTSPAFVSTLYGKMGGRWPRYFQALLRVKYKDGVPTETRYLLHRELPRRE